MFVGHIEPNGARISWERPFGEDVVKTYRTASGVFALRNGVDPDAIRKAQRPLIPHLEVLHDRAAELFDKAGADARIISQRYARIKILYRNPDYSDFIQGFFHDQTAHMVLLFTADETLHPLVESLCPSRRTADLKTAEVSALRASMQFGLLARNPNDLTLPPRTRVVFPEVLRFIIHWLREIEGPINNASFTTRRPSDRQMRPNATELVLPGRHLN